MGADAAWGIGSPYSMQNFVEQHSALRRSQARRGGFPALRGEASCSEGLERALRLSSEHARSAGDIAGRKGNLAEVFDRDSERVWMRWSREFRGQRLWRCG